MKRGYNPCHAALAATCNSCFYRLSCHPHKRLWTTHIRCTRCWPRRKNIASRRGGNAERRRWGIRRRCLPSAPGRGPVFHGCRGMLSQLVLSWRFLGVQGRSVGPEASLWLHAINPSTAAYEGTLTCCGLGECPNAAINQSSYTEYKSTTASQRPTCNGVPCLAITITCKSAAICTVGTCAFEQPLTDAAEPD